MKISKELFDSISDACPQLKKYGISIGLSHPMGNFLDNDNDFVLFIGGVYNPETWDIDNDEYYLVEYNKFEHESEGILSKLTSDLNQKSEDIDNFLIDFYLMLKSGKIQVFKEKQYKHYFWTPTGDGKYHISEKRADGTLSYCKKLCDIEDLDLRSHIKEQECLQNLD